MDLFLSENYHNNVEYSDLNAIHNSNIVEQRTTAFEFFRQYTLELIDF